MKSTACANCGTPYDASAAPGACRTCGSPLDWTAPRPAAAKGGGIGRAAVVASGLVLLFAAGVAWIVLWRQREPVERPPVPVVEVAIPPLPRAVPIPSPEPAPIAEGQLSAAFEFHRTVPATGNGLYVLGVVTNTSAVPIAKPKLSIVVLDARGNEVGMAHGFALDDVVEPATRSYLSTIVTDPPPHEELRFEVVPRKVGFAPTPATGLTVAVSRLPMPRSSEASGSVGGSPVRSCGGRRSASSGSARSERQSRGGRADSRCA
jgi:hypothetical protein